MFYAYILRSEQNPDVLYHGSTAGLKKRLQAHNLGRNRSTIALRPWQLVWYAGFESETAAKNFERHLKTSSGKAFARKRLLSPNTPA